MLYQGRLKELTPLPESSDIGAVVAAVPRPNQAFWTLSALWTGWIWGQDAVAPIRQVLSRQRYDWNWHAHALQSSFNNVQRLVDQDCKIWELVAENEPMLLLSTLLAADTAGFRMTGFSQFHDDALAQCQFEIQTEIAMTVKPADSPQPGTGIRSGIPSGERGTRLIPIRPHCCDHQTGIPEYAGGRHLPGKRKPDDL